MRASILILIISIGGLGFNFPSLSQNSSIPAKTRILFLLDASGSMLAPWEKGLRIDAAKELLVDLVDSLSADPNLELALRVYGHQFHKRFKNCKDSKLEVGFTRNNHEFIQTKLIGLEPKGTTPLAYSLEQAARDFPTDPGTRNIIIIITDGLESCDGDPCAISRQLQMKDIFLRPFVIGLGMDVSFDEKFNCLGRFFDAKNLADFRNALHRVIIQSLGQTTVSVELLDINDDPKETNVNITFINNSTQIPTYEFIHYRDENGRPDSIEIETVLSYDIIANTIPPVIKRSIDITGGKHNVITLKTPQGNLSITQDNVFEYKKGVKAIVKKAGKSQTINVQNIAEDQKYLVGNYDLEITTLPRRYFRQIKVEQNKTTRIDISPPGVVNIRTSTEGIGSLYEVSSDGTEKWIFNLDPKIKIHSLAIQPGKYKVVFRAKKARGSKFTDVEKFTVQSGATVNINVLTNK